MCHIPKYVDQIYHFKGAWDVPSFCGLKIIKKVEKVVVIATDLYDHNPGSSVTSWAKELATELIQKFKIDPQKLVFIEHLPDRKSNLEFLQETFHLVSFEWSGDKFINSSWAKISKEEVDNLIAKYSS